MRASTHIEVSDVKEATRLIKSSIVTIESPDIEIDAENDVESDARLAQQIARNILKPSMVR